MAKGTTRGEVRLKSEAEQPPPGPGLASQKGWQPRRPEPAPAEASGSPRRGRAGPCPWRHCAAVIKGGQSPQNTAHLSGDTGLLCTRGRNEARTRTGTASRGAVATAAWTAPRLEVPPLALLTSGAGLFSGGPPRALWGVQHPWPPPPACQEHRCPQTPPMSPGAESEAPVELPCQEKLQRNADSFSWN